MLLLMFFLLLLIAALLAAGALWLAIIWLAHENNEDAEVASALTLSQHFARQLEAHALWSSLTAWMATKPLRVEDQRGK
jgi:hypothetical protein